MSTIEEAVLDLIQRNEMEWHEKLKAMEKQARILSARNKELQQMIDDMRVDMHEMRVELDRGAL